MTPYAKALHATRLAATPLGWVNGRTNGATLSATALTMGVMTIQLSEPTRLMLRLDEAAAELRIGLTTFRAMVDAGTVPSVMVGRRRRILASDLLAYVDRLSADRGSAA